MSTVSKRPNVKLAKLMYKYADEKKETQQPEPIHEEIEKKPEEIKDYESYRPINFSWFIEKKVAAMGWPRSVENLNYIADAGVDLLITLSPEKQPPILECDRKLKWTEIRIKEFSAPTLKQILKFIEICKRAELRREVIGVHCRQGRGRTGTMLACYLVYFKKMTPERAILTVRLQRPGSCETYEQEKIVCHYHDCLRGTITKPDYRMMENKYYFDFTMKYLYDDDEKERDDGDDEDDAQDVVVIPEKKPETLQLRKKKKSKAMVINHKIYF